MYKLKLGRSIFVSDHFQTDLDECISLGFESFDLDLCTFWNDRENESITYDKYLKQTLEYIKSKKDKIFFNGCHISFGYYWDISTTVEANRVSNIERIREIMSIIDEYDPYCYIIHPSFEPIMDDERGERLSQLIRSIKEIDAFKTKRIAYENLPRTCLLNTVEEINEIYEQTGIGICCDVNHFLRERSEEAILKIKPEIYTLHISDHDYVNERHWLPLKGKISWGKLLKNLETINYNNCFSYEVPGSSVEIRQNYELLKELQK